MSVTLVEVAGSAVSLTNVEYSVTIYHGRNDVTDSPQPSNCELVLRSTTGVPVAIGDTLAIEAYNTDRFAGYITDVTVTHDVDGLARYQVTGIGNLSKLGLYTVGEAGFSEETLEDRVDGILTTTGLNYTLNAEPSMVLLATTAGYGGSALETLTSYCTETGATMCDLPNGNILFESYTRRGYDYNPATWAYLTESWDSSEYQYLDWANAYQAGESAPTPVSIPASAIAWEPIFRNSVTAVINRATVTYGDSEPQDDLTVSDSTSITRYGLRDFVLTTSLSDPYDALTRASAIITAQSEPKYDLTNLEVLVHTVDGATRTALMGLVQGDRVLINSLPQPGPYSQFLGVVEGWGETYSPNFHSYTLSLSDPRYSYAMAQWISVDAALTWGGVNSSIQWYNVVLPSDLE